MLAPVRQAQQGDDFNQVGAGFKPRVSPPKSGVLAMLPLGQSFMKSVIRGNNTIATQPYFRSPEKDHQFHRRGEV